MSLLSTLAAKIKEESRHDKAKVIFTNIGPMCRRCWNFGKALSPGCCLCTGDVKLETRPFVEYSVLEKPKPKTKKKK